MKSTGWSSKLISLNELLETVYRWHDNGETFAFTNGVFDIIHRGHIHSLERAASFADHLVVGVNSDRSARLLGKDPGRPIQNEKDRAACIAAMAVVDLVVLFDEPTPYELLSELKPDVLVKGGDYKTEEVVGREFAGRLEIIERIEGLSTSDIINKLRAE